jgi:hypothetical protein
MARVFFSYSHDDETFRDQLEKHLAMLKHQGFIESWHDRRISAGSSFDEAIDRELDAANIILLLVSSSFLASAYCYSREMVRAMERHAAGIARVVPVIVRPCDWHSAPFGKLLAVPKDGKAITTWPNYDEAYVDVAQQIRGIVEQSASSPGKPPAVAQRAAASVDHAMQLRSSNLRLKKEFTELDRDHFLRESFEFAERFFQSSLVELQSRNSSIECRFQRVDGNTFTAAIYKGGKKSSECSVHVGSGGFRHTSIAFSHDASARGNSFNESLSVEVDDQSMYLKAMGMAMRESGQKLSQEGAAEFLWALLIERLQ